MLIMCSINPTAASQRVGRDALNSWTWSTRGKKEKHEHDKIKLTQLWHTGGGECLVCHAFNACVRVLWVVTNWKENLSSLTLQWEDCEAGTRGGEERRGRCSLNSSINQTKGVVWRSITVPRRRKYPLKNHSDRWATSEWTLIQHMSELLNSLASVRLPTHTNSQLFKGFTSEQTLIQLWGRNEMWVHQILLVHSIVVLCTHPETHTSLMLLCMRICHNKAAACSAYFSRLYNAPLLT